MRLSLGQTKRKPTTTTTNDNDDYLFRTRWNSCVPILHVTFYNIVCVLPADGTYVICVI